MWRNRGRLLVTLLGVAALGIGLSLGYPGFGSASPAGPTCPFLGAAEDPQSDRPERVCPYSGVGTRDGDRTDKAKCPYSGSERDSKEADVERRPFKRRDLRNVV